MLRRIRRDEGGFVLVVVVLRCSSFSCSSRRAFVLDRLAEHLAARSGLERGAVRGRGRLDDYIFHLNQDGSYWQYSRLQPAARRQRAFTDWVWSRVPQRCLLPVLGGHLEHRRGRNGQGHVDRDGRRRHPVRRGDVSAAKLPRLPVLHGLETKDPAAYGRATTTRRRRPRPTAPSTTTRGVTSPVAWTSRGTPTGTPAPEITFISHDTINGPLHTNDALRVSGSPHFNGETSTSWDGNRRQAL